MSKMSITWIVYQVESISVEDKWNSDTTSIEALYEIDNFNSEEEAVAFIEDLINEGSGSNKYSVLKTYF